MSTRKFPATMAVTAVATLGLFAFTGPAQASTGTATKHVHNATAATGAALAGKRPAVTAAPNIAAANPAGYKVVNSASLSAPANSQTHGVVNCPSGKVALGGGAFFSSSSTGANINSSYPLGGTWAVDVNNNSASASTFAVYAVCGKAPKKYAVVAGTQTVVNAGAQLSNITATCASGRAIGGGMFSNSFSLLTTINSSIALTANGWRVDANNGSASPESVIPYVVCGNLAKYHIVIGAATSNPAGTQTGATTLCGHGVPVSGGGFSNSGSTAVAINTTYPVTGGWRTYMNNGSSAAATFETYAVCSG